MFKSSDLQEHFKKFDWYKKNEESTREIRRGKILTKVDKENIRMLKKMEDEIASENQLIKPGTTIFVQWDNDTKMSILCDNGQYLEWRPPDGFGKGKWNLKDAKISIKINPVCKAEDLKKPIKNAEGDFVTSRLKGCKPANYNIENDKINDSLVPELKNAGNVRSRFIAKYSNSNYQPRNILDLGYQQFGQVIEH